MNDPNPISNRRRERTRQLLMSAGIALALVIGLYFWFTGGRYMSTDDAYVQAAQTSISSNVSGRVVELDVHDNQAVRRGDVLFRIDPRPFQIAVDAAKAKFATARMQVAAGKATYRQEIAALKAARFTQDYRQTEFDRQKRLLASGIASQSQFDQARHGLDTASQQVTSAQQQADGVLTMLGGNPDIAVDEHPAVRQAKADLDHAELELSYTVIRAPDDGVVTKVEQLQVGDYVTAASPVFALISTHDVWVEANFKEDQLTYMRPGQPVSVVIDAYPDHALKGRVASIAPGTGAQFSVLPAENASGNWVKVVQRLPVRIEFDAGGDPPPLQTGLSAQVEVDTGHHRHLFGGGHAAK